MWLILPFDFEQSSAGLTALGWVVALVGAEDSAVAVKTTYVYFTAPYHPISKQSTTPKHFINCGCALPSSSAGVALLLLVPQFPSRVLVWSQRSQLSWDLIGVRSLSQLYSHFLTRPCSPSCARRSMRTCGEIQKPGGGYGCNHNQFRLGFFPFGEVQELKAKPIVGTS